ncbi:MAG: mechanosensitive ion channel family protein [Bacteroidales bacterium]|jgi:small-conductance mechanosensitive channel|nr:mechanosensitive ion channel family protein [Bacteroidales bacterium]
MKKFIFIIFILVYNFACNAQTENTIVVKSDTIVEVITDSLNSQNADSTQQFVNNSAAIDLIKQSQNEDLTASIKENLLLQQLMSLQENDNKQRMHVQQQLNEFKKTDSIRKAIQQRQIDSLKQNATGVPVILHYDTVYIIYTNLGSFTAKERAELNSDKILKAAKVFSLKNDSLIIADNGTTSDIIYNGTILTSISEMDAMWKNTDKNTLATEYSKQIYESIKYYKESVSFWNIMKMIGLAILVIVLQFFIIKGISYLFRKVIDKKIVSKKDKWFKGIKIKTLEVLNPEKEIKVVLFISKVLRYFLYIIFLYLTIPLLFSIFPITQRFAETLFGWILSPLKSIGKSFINYFPNLLKIAIIIFVVHYILKFFKYVTNEIQNGKLVIPGFYSDWAKSTFNILRIFIYAFTIVLIFPLLPESDSNIFQGVSVFVGIIFSLGSTSVIANLMAGMVITYMRPFVVGDRIKIGDISGDVTEKSPFVIRIKTHKNEIVTVPNSTVLSANVINYSSMIKDDGLILHTEVSVGYDIPWRKVNELLIEAALKTDMIEKNPSPFVLESELKDSYILYQLCAYTKSPSKQAGIYSLLNQNIIDIFNQAGIELMSPIYSAIRDGNKSTIPEDNNKN